MVEEFFRPRSVAFYPPAWDFANLLHIGTALLIFCSLASCVYAFNDVVDRRKDALHPRKRFRPIPAGIVSPRLGTMFSIFLAVAGLTAAWVLEPAAVLLVSVLYLANNLAYCLGFRNKVILDVMSIAFGFVLRIFVGCLAVSILPSNWMIVCGFSLALLLGFGKRRLELACSLERPDECRKTLECYPIEFLNILLGVSSMMCLMSYMSYTISPATVALHGTENLLYTTPFVLYGVFRYAIRCIRGQGDGPVDVLTQDKSFIINTVLWILTVGGIVLWK